MNQKDYKAIAKIINIMHQESFTDNDTIQEFADKIAEYFEKEGNFGLMGRYIESFNKEQFLKDCGVE